MYMDGPGRHISDLGPHRVVTSTTFCASAGHVDALHLVDANGCGCYTPCCQSLTMEPHLRRMQRLLRRGRALLLLWPLRLRRPKL